MVEVIDAPAMKIVVAVAAAVAPVSGNRNQPVVSAIFQVEENGINRTSYFIQKAISDTDVAFFHAISLHFFAMYLQHNIVA